MKKIFYNLVLLLLVFLFNSCEKDVSVSPPLDPVPQGFFYVNSLPQGSTIYLNGRNTGRITPDSLPFIETGSYEISLKRAYFKDTTLSAEAVEGEKRTITVDYYSNPAMYGNLNLKSTPAGAEIYLNDSSLKVFTPYVLNKIFPGQYSVTLKKVGYRDNQLSIAVQSSKTTDLTTSLKDTSIWIDYQTFNSGLQNGVLTTIASDNNGVKWIGTANSGLIKYDENSFNNYNISNSDIPSNTINYVNVDHNNNVWVCTNNGIGVFNGSTWEHYTTANSKLLSNNVNVVKFDFDGTAWIGTQSNLVKFDGVSWTSFTVNSPKVEYTWVTDIALDHNKNIWLGTNRFGVMKFDGTNYTIYQNVSHNLLSDAIASLTIENDNILVINNPMTAAGGKVLPGGLSVISNNSVSTYSLGPNFLLSRNIFADSKGKKWISTREGIYTFIGPGAFNLINRTNTGIASNDISQVIEDKNKVLWITTLGGGLIKYKGNL